MQKNKKPALRATTGKAGKTGNSGKAGSTGKTRTTGEAGKAGKRQLTTAQREAKRLRDREYRNRMRAKKRGSKTLAQKRPDGVVPPRAMSAQDVFSVLGRCVVRDLVMRGLPVAGGMPVSPEKGVTCQDIVLPDGARARVTLVDVDEIDPLSECSPIPEPVRRHLLRRRMAQEISDIVDAHRDLS